MAQHFRLSTAARTISLGQALRMADAEVETTFAPAIWWRLLHKSVLLQVASGPAPPGTTHLQTASQSQGAGCHSASPAPLRPPLRELDKGWCRRTACGH